MATKRMLIDASHAEETRVLVVNGNRLEDFDVEVETRRPLKGNIYLAKVTRVEPSLQAAFIDYGGNRHGFLAFSEIHPDYYQIPIADREALLAEERAEAKEAVEADETEAGNEDPVETLGGDDSEEVEARRPGDQHRRYKIQEVIKRRQILLVQVVKEERGTKGAALTTYLSLAGRYCVLMPNTNRGGGISRKISNVSDRKKLKKTVGDLGVLEGMAVIVRTAGAERSRAEIRRDYDYLLRLWSQIRELTLSSIAPSLVHEEGDLIKRSIRDLYTKEIDEVVVHGDDGYRLAKDFMKILIPSHAKKVQKYKDVEVPLTHKYHIDNQLEVIHSAEVHLKSGGYIVINPTEALVAIDVNSGRATKERNIEETALKTNLEAADEIARHLKLRDLAGLIVIDFIDMEVSRNQTRVERAVKEAMRSDRARIQIGRISPFGLLELSRQRLRPSLIETSSEPCPHCNGSGVRRSTETTAVEVLRAIEEEGIRKRGVEMTVFVPTEVALYLLNRKRDTLAELEDRFEIKIFLENDDNLIPPDLRIERDGEVVSEDKSQRTPTNAAKADGVTDSGGRKRRRRRSRRKKRGDQGADDGFETPEVSKETDGEDKVSVPEHEEVSYSDGADGERSKRRRRGRRGGRRRRQQSEDASAETAESTEEEAQETVALLEVPGATELLVPPASDDGDVIALPNASAPAKKESQKPKRQRTSNARTSEAKVDEADAGYNAKKAREQAEEPLAEKSKHRRRKVKSEKVNASPAKAAHASASPEKTGTGIESEAEPKSKPRRRSRPMAKKAEQEQGAATDAKARSKAKPKTSTEDTQIAAKTTVIQVGDDAGEGEQPSRSGWWNRG